MTTAVTLRIALPIRRYLALVAFLLFVSALAQLVLPDAVGATSAWSTSAGWQREIAFFDIAAFILVARTLRLGDVSAARTVTIALVVLQTLVAVNHGIAALETNAPLNGLMFWVNALSALLGTSALLTDAS